MKRASPACLLTTTDTASDGGPCPPACADHGRLHGAGPGGPGTTRLARLRRTARRVLPWRRALGVPVLLASALCVGACQESDAGTLNLSFTGTPAYPVATARFLAGPPHGPHLTEADLVATGSTTAEAGPASVPASGVLPVVGAVVLASAETVAVVRGEIQLYPGYRHFVQLIVAPNLSGWFICSSAVGQTPIQDGGADPDTLYVWYLGIEPGKQPPVC